MALKKKRIAFFLIFVMFFMITKSLAAPPTSPSEMPESYMVTLITGDEVAVTKQPNGAYDIAITPQKRRGGVTPVFNILRHSHRRTLVIPSDISHLIPNALDEKFFNINYLIDHNLDDNNTSRITTLVKLKKHQTPFSFSNIKGLEKAIPLNIFNGIAVSSEKESLKKNGNPLFLPQKKGGLISLKGVEKIYLNASLKLSLDKAVPLVGGDSVLNQTNLDGRGVNIAVMDTGIDNRHPDFRFPDGTSKIIVNENFTCVATTDPEMCDDTSNDLNGHGTHVAGIASGTGAFFKGKYKGMAPMSNLLNIKVFGKYGLGSYASVIKGLDAAILGTNNIRGDEPEKEADVISISFGHLYDGGEDPVSDLITSAIEKYGVIAVISAGNDGESGPFSVNTPGTSRAAITVGMSSNTNAPFVDPSSSKGPVDTENFLPKPDIMAPGVDIMAPCAVNDPQGCNPDFPYLSYSGASMATPVVAGAVALMIQQRRLENKEIVPHEIKDDLLLTAEKIPGTPERESLYAQGAGLLQIQKAVSPIVRIEPSKLDIGAVSSHQAILKRRVTITNSGDTQRSFSSDFSLKDSKVEPYSSGGNTFNSEMSVTPGQFTLDPGTSQTLSFTVNLKNLPCSVWNVYEGEILITENNESVGKVTFGLTRKKPILPVEISGQLPNGSLAPHAAISIFDANDPNGFFQFRFVYQQPYALKVPEGTYNVVAYLMNRQTDPTHLYRISHFDHDISGEKERIILDASKAKPVELKMTVDPTTTVRRHVTSLVYQFNSDSEKKVEISCGNFSKSWKQFSVLSNTSPKSGAINVYNHWLLTNSPVSDSPVVYDVVDTRKSEGPFEKVIDLKERYRMGHVIHKMYGDMDVMGRSNRLSCPADTTDFPTCMMIFQKDLLHPSWLVRDEYFSPEEGRYAQLVWPEDRDYSYFCSVDAVKTLNGASAGKVFYERETFKESFLKRPITNGLNTMLRVKEDLNDLLIFNESPFLFDASAHIGYNGLTADLMMTINDEPVTPFFYAYGYKAVRIPSGDRVKVMLMLSTTTSGAWSNPRLENRKKMTFYVDGGEDFMEIPLPIISYRAEDIDLQNRINTDDPLHFNVKLRSTTDDSHQFKNASVQIKDFRGPLSPNQENVWRTIRNTDVDVDEKEIEVETDCIYQPGKSPFVSIKLTAETSTGFLIEDVIERAFIFDN